MALPRSKQTTFKPELRAIPTHYNGHKFRSRTEARWAVALDKLGVEYEYEAEGYDLDGINYLPDFYLPKEDCFLEIKGGPPTDQDWEKAGRLAFASKKFVNILSGQPGRHTLSFARPKDAAPDNLLDWLASAPEQRPHFRAQLLQPYARTYAFPKSSLASFLPRADWSQELWDGALSTYVRVTNNATRYYDLDFCPQHERLQVWHVWYSFSLAEAGPYENERYDFYLNELVHAGPPYILGAAQPMGVNAHTYFEGDKPVPHSAEWVGALAAARSARFEFGESG